MAEHKEDRLRDMYARRASDIDHEAVEYLERRYDEAVRKQEELDVKVKGTLSQRLRDKAARWIRKGDR